MMSTPTQGRVLVVDDELELRTALQERLPRYGYETEAVGSGSEALQALKEQDFDVLLTDLIMPGMDGLLLMKAALEIDPHVVSIVMTGQATIETAVEAMKEGAFDYVMKPFKVASLLPALTRAMGVRRTRLENVQLRESLSVHDLTRALALTHDLQTILDKVMDAALEQCQADEGSIMRPTKDGKQLSVAVVRGQDRHNLTGQLANLGDTISGWVASHREMLTLNGRVDDPRFKPVRPREDIFSAVCIPMLVGGEAMGVLNVNATDRHRPFTVGEIKGLSFLSATAGLALEEAALFAEVQQSHSQLSAIFESAPVTMMIVDQERRVCRVNRHGAALTHRSDDRIIGNLPGEALGCLNSLLDERGCGFGPACSHCLLRSAALDTLKTGNSHLEVEAHLPLGREGKEGQRDFLVSTAAVRVGNDGGRAALICLQDITERNKTREDLRRSLDETQQRGHENAALLEAARAVLQYRDFLSAATTIFEACKRALSATAGFVALLSPEGDAIEVVYLNSGDAVHTVDPVLRMPIRGLREVAYREGGFVYDNAFKQSEWAQYVPKGHTDLENVAFAPLLIDDMTVGLLGLANKKGGFTDADARLANAFAELAAIAFLNARTVEFLQDREGELEETNLRLQKALADLKATQEQVVQQERLRALGQMASGIAHDFNNALAPILGFSELMLMRPEGLDDREKVERYLKLIRTGAEDASNVVRRLREFYRKKEEGEVFLPVDLNQLVEQAVDLTQPKWRDQSLANGAPVEVRKDLKKVPKISGNESELREAMTNLIFNAVDAMPEGGTITLRTATDGAGDAHDSVVLEVSDTGVGMDEATRQRCLDPFFTTKGTRGTGMGLSMVFGTVIRHEGAIEVESKEGKGTTFRISLPIPDTSRKHQEAASGAAPHTDRPLRILIVDDDTRARSFMTALLEMDGHSFEVAGDGREGIDRFDAGRFDLVITDRAMPRMNGDQFAAAVKEQSPTTPVIMVTGFGDLMDATGEIVFGVDRFLSKPVTVAALREALAQATGS
ncbi:MAG: hypothetical protein CO095_14475 [Armatimonadetes bacterium CG_4_9_14_3_um_filter_58_7]|nr:MAG: hypothetical protein CO095_14475 [Armatimonadetes bacterium CG_4_9_14_3_um_filter_58_7]